MIKKIFISVFILLCIWVNEAFSQKNLLGIQDFKEPLGEWFEAGEVQLNNENEKQLDVIAGKGVLFNGEKGRTNHLITKESHGDAKL